MEITDYTPYIPLNTPIAWNYTNRQTILVLHSLNLLSCYVGLLEVVLSYTESL